METNPFYRTVLLYAFCQQRWPTIGGNGEGVRIVGLDRHRTVAQFQNRSGANVLNIWWGPPQEKWEPETRRYYKRARGPTQFPLIWPAISASSLLIFRFVIVFSFGNYSMIDLQTLINSRIVYIIYG